MQSEEYFMLNPEKYNCLIAIEEIIKDTLKRCPSHEYCLKVFFARIKFRQEQWIKRFTVWRSNLSITELSLLYNRLKSGKQTNRKKRMIRFVLNEIGDN